MPTPRRRLGRRGTFLCLFAGISNATNSGWAKAISVPKCTKVLAPSDPQSKS